MLKSARAKPEILCAEDQPEAAQLALRVGGFRCQATVTSDETASEHRVGLDRLNLASDPKGKYGFHTASRLKRSLFSLRFQSVPSIDPFMHRDDKPIS